MTLLKTMDRGGQVCPGKDGPAALIDCLSKAKVIPRDVAACMRTITEMRNAAEYEEKVSKARSFAVEAALQVIREWADVSEITLPDGLKV
jgi:hypothetical protein